MISVQKVYHVYSGKACGSCLGCDAGFASYKYALDIMGLCPRIVCFIYIRCPCLWYIFLPSLCSVRAFCAFKTSNMQPLPLLFLWLSTTSLAAAQICPDYAHYAAAPHAPFSGGAYNLSYQRPAPSCRTFISSAVESTIARLNATITDPDLSRLFENSFPNTLDTAIKWKGYAADSDDEELTFVITGDMYTASYSKNVQYS